jgi:hypothetical protein
MRVAIVALVALAAVAGPLPAFASCSSSGSGGGLDLPKKILNPVLELVGLPPLGGSSSATTSTTNNTTNITNNSFTTTAEGTAQDTPAAGAGGPAALSAFSGNTGGGASAGGGGGAGGGFGGMGGGFSGSSTVSGTPINPSADLTAQAYTGNGTSSGGGSGSVNEPFTMVALGATQVESVGSIAPESADATAGPLTAGVTLGSSPAPASTHDDLMTVAMASPRIGAPASTEGFAFDEAATATGRAAAPFGGTAMLTALIGVGVLSAGWAWRSLVL